jgi:PhnB protein
MKVMMQLAFNGQCRQAFEQYEKVLGGKITVMNTFGGNEAKLPPGSVAAAPDQIRFAEIQVGDYAILGNDLREQDFKPMQGFNIALHVKDAAEAKRVFDGLADGGRIDTPLSKVDWSPAFGLVTDRFDVPWLILAEGG